MYVRGFIRVNIYTYINICVYIIFLKNYTLLSGIVS
jgi:hypothetical protein